MELFEGCDDPGAWLADVTSQLAEAAQQEAASREAARNRYGQTVLLGTQVGAGGAGILPVGKGCGLGLAVYSS
jgi:hypothetical protein